MNEDFMSGIWATNQLHKNNTRTRNSGFRDIDGLPKNTPFGQNKDFVHNQTTHIDSGTRPALSSLSATSNPVIVKKETSPMTENWNERIWENKVWVNHHLLK
mgnify:CR=1 FL=1